MGEVDSVRADLPPRLKGVRFDRVIGQGGSGTVWRAYYERVDTPVAVKVMNAEGASSEAIARFLEEGRVLAELDHPCIVRGYKADFVDGKYCFVMDCVRGYSFAERLSETGPIREDEALVVLDSVSSALGYAWREHALVHCDIKPENIMADEDGTIKITDLGLFRRPGSEDGEEPRPQSIAGTPAYMSPERIYAEIPDPASDIYSLGATLYQLVTGNCLFDIADNDAMMQAHCNRAMQAPDPRHYAPDVSAPFATLLARMCVKERYERYATWEEVAADSARVQRGAEIAPPRAVSSIALTFPQRAGNLDLRPRF